ncbi:MAG: Uma2 family endonuclease, partial [Runella slithyformis]
PSKITVKYADVPALIDVEVDVKVDLSRKKDFDYVMRKTQKLLDFGTQKVVWIFTETQKVMVAQVNEPWLTYDWSRDIALLDGVTFNIGQYLADEGVETKTEA